jgi:phosphatidylglycerol lysyltransferase
MKTPRLQSLVPLLVLVLFGAALWVIHHALADYHYQDILRQLRAIPAPRLAAALILTGLSYLVMTAYDRLAISYVGHPLERGKVPFASFISYAFSNNIGLSLLTSGSIRYRLYSAWGLSAEEIARVVGFTVVTFWLGLLATGGTVFLSEPLILPAGSHLPLVSIHALGLLSLAAVAGYLLLVGLRRVPFRLRGWEFQLPAPRLALGQLLVGALDWVLAGSVLYALLPASAPISFGQWLGVFMLAQLVALISHVPGGLGVFESLVLTFAPDVPVDTLIGALLVYRGIYYLLPLGLAALLLGWRELRRKQGRLVQATQFAGRWTSVMVPHLLAASTLAGGAILLFSGATPAIPSRLHWLQDFLPLPVVELSHFLGSLAGAGLLILARGLQRRLDAAYLLAAVLLAAGSLFSLLKGVDYEEALLFLMMLAALLPCRRHFYRRSPLLGEPFSASWVATILLVLACSLWLGLFSYKHQAYSGELWWHFALRGDAPRFLRAEVGASVLLLLFAVVKLLRPTPGDPDRPGPAELERALEVIRRVPQTSANLALLGDKALLFNPAQTAFIMYAVEGRSWVALGDPVGEKTAQEELAWQFRQLCERHGGWPVFYEVGPETLPLYLDLGLTPVKIGEKARVALAEFSLAGGSRSGLRYILRRLEKDGCSFEVVPAAAVPALLPELQAVSDAWLAAKHTREKGFSLGYFDAGYLRHFPCALVRQEGAIVAFANLWPGGDREELSVDLMRFHPTAPSGAMDYLFVSLILWGQQQGFRWFDLGMAPLAGLENRSFAPLWNRLGALVFRHGEHFYNFQGLREYKGKFGPEWTPRYLACPGGLALPRILTNIATLISGGLKGVVGK